MKSGKHDADWKAVEDVLGSGLHNIRVRSDRQIAPASLDLSRIGAKLRPDARAPYPKNFDEARKRLEEYLDERDVRFASASAFLADNDVQMDQSIESVRSVNRFVAGSVFANKEKTDLDPAWYGFIWDYALFLGDLAIQQASEFNQIKWDVIDVGLSKLGQPFKAAIVISNYPTKHFNMRPDKVIHQLGIRMLRAKPNDLTAGGRFDHPHDFFEQFLEKSLLFAKDSRR